jgi:hypothetical protein
MLKIKNKKVDIKNDNGDVVVTDGKTEYYRANKSTQTISIANSIYWSVKYEEVI